MTEHHGYNPDDGLDGWMRKVFACSIKYTVVRPIGAGKMNRADLATYPEALILAIREPRALLYMVTAEGRAVCIPRKEFADYLALYNLLTGQQLKMPPALIDPTFAKRNDDVQKSERQEETRIRLSDPGVGVANRPDRVRLG